MGSKDKLKDMPKIEVDQETESSENELTFIRPFHRASSARKHEPSKSTKFSLHLAAEKAYIVKSMSRLRERSTSTRSRSTASAKSVASQHSQNIGERRRILFAKFLN